MVVRYTDKCSRSEQAAADSGSNGGTMARITSLAEAVSEVVHDGDTVSFEGFTHLIPFAAGHEVIRQRRRGRGAARGTGLEPRFGSAPRAARRPAGQRPDVGHPRSPEGGRTVRVPVTGDRRGDRRRTRAASWRGGAADLGGGPRRRGTRR